MLVVSSDVRRLSQYLQDQISLAGNNSKKNTEEVLRRTSENLDERGVRIVDLCIKNIGGNLNEKITLEDLAALCGCDKFQVIRAFRRILGTTPHAYILETRVFRAAELLRSGEPAAKVASEVGFVDQSHLIRYFKRHVGATPKQFVCQNQ